MSLKANFIRIAFRIAVSYQLSAFRDGVALGHDSKLAENRELRTVNCGRNEVEPAL